MTIFAALTGSAGVWTGTNGFRLMPADPLHDAPATAELSLKAGGNLAAIAYSWSHPTDGAQDGLLVMGAAGDPDTVTALWGDSWHQSPEPRVLAGTVAGGLITLSYEYEAGWRWAITVDLTDTEAVRVQMDNVIPAEAAEGAPAGAYPAMVMNLHRSTP